MANKDYEFNTSSNVDKPWIFVWTDLYDKSLIKQKLYCLLFFSYAIISTVFETPKNTFSEIKNYVKMLY